MQAIVTLAQQLGLRVVAEGVEDQATWDLLETLGCDIAQGYYLSRPIPAQDLERWLDERKEAAVRLKVSLSWLAKARMRGDGPPFIRVGRSIRYAEAALIQWMK